MILIADSGSTKTLWCLIDNDGKEHHFKTEGFNPYFSNQQQIVNSLQNNMLADIDADQVMEIYFYGAGCFPDKAYIIKEAMNKVFTKAAVQVELDLLGAARSLLGNTDGFVAILGTGSNSCLFSEGKVVQNIDSLGYLLGDEGSGCYIGKKLLANYLRGYLPPELAALFLDTYRLSAPDIMDALYAKPLANRFCASFSLFVGENIEHSFMYKLVTDCFDDFFNNLVSNYPNYQHTSFNCVGSVGYCFKDILELSCRKFNMRFGNILQSPMEGLTLYHRNVNQMR